MSFIAMLVLSPGRGGGGVDGNGEGGGEGDVEVTGMRGRHIHSSTTGSAVWKRWKFNVQRPQDLDIRTLTDQSPGKNHASIATRLIKHSSSIIHPL